MTATHFARGNAYYRKGAFEKAIDCYQKAIDSRSDFYVYYDNLAKALHALGRADESRVAILQAKKLQQQGSKSWIELGGRSKEKPIKPNKFYALRHSASSWRSDPAVQAMLEWVPPFEKKLKKSYQRSSLSSESDTFVLFRIIGNDLYPRHAKGQSRHNLRFILENEPDLADCEKRWVVNRIFDASERQAIINLLEQHGQSYLEIPFEAEAFAQIGWDYSTFPEVGFLSSAAFHKLGPEQQERVLTATYRKKNLYMMNNNGARNAALEDGRGRAKWVLPWDGNCFVTSAAWQAIRSAVSSAPHLPYFAVPMQRLMNNAELLRDDFTLSPTEEPQLLFRRDVREHFGENHPYGRRPKVELFWRLRVPGKWDSWRDDPWDQPRSVRSADAGAWGVAGWVARLTSGKPQLEATTAESFKNRGLERQKAIRSAIDHVTWQVSAQTDPIGLTSYRFEAIEALRNEHQGPGDSAAHNEVLQTLLKNATEAMERQPESPVDKPEPGPSGDLQDYYHPAPYWWPNPITTDGLPYVRRDGERVLGTRMYEPESHRYDRTRLQRLFDDTTTLALAAFVTGDQRYATHAVRWLERWFLDPTTRMNPHLTYAQVRRGRNGNRGFQTGVIEMKDLYYALDAMRLLHHIDALSTEQMKRLRAWFRNYLDWLLTSEQGRKEAQSRNNHGTYYDLQVAALSAFLDDHDTLYAALARAEERISLQITPKGVQHEEMARTNTAHYCCFTLQGWLNLLNLSARYDGFMINRVSMSNHPLYRAIDWLMKHKSMPWPYEQIEVFDSSRFIPIAFFANTLGVNGEAQSLTRDPCAPVCFPPHDGINPYWELVRAQIGVGSSQAVEPRDLKATETVLFKRKFGQTLHSGELLHVVVMRFGIGIFDESWLRYRLDLLKAIAIPSLLAQSSQRFHLVLQVDRYIATSFLNELTLVFSSFNSHEIRGIELHSYRRRDLANVVAELLLPHHKGVVTTRMDDDDAVTEHAAAFTEKAALQALSEERENVVIAIEEGYRFVLEDARALKGRHSANGIFLSMACGIKDLSTNIYSFAHTRLSQAYSLSAGTLVYVGWEDARWLYTCHKLSDTNYEEKRKKVMTSKGSFYVDERFLKGFNIKEGVIKDFVSLHEGLPQLGSNKTTEYINDVEKKILTLRKNGGDRFDVERLLEQRRLRGALVIDRMRSDA